MAYATVQDVEARLGYTLDAAEETSLSIFLDDASDSLDLALEAMGIDPSTIQESRRTSVVASKGVAYVYQIGVDPTIASHTQAADTNSESISYRSTSAEKLYELTRAELKRLGVSTFRFSSFAYDFQWGDPTHPRGVL